MALSVVSGAQATIGMLSAADPGRDIRMYQSQSVLPRKQTTVKQGGADTELSGFLKHNMPVNRSASVVENKVPMQQPASQVPPLNLNSQIGKIMSAPQTFKSLGSVNQGSDKGSSAKKSFGIDFTFNTIKDVKKVSWKESAPWFREIYDGFCWLAYCMNDGLQRDMYLKAEMRSRYGANGAGKMSVEEFFSS